MRQIIVLTLVGFLTSGCVLIKPPRKAYMYTSKNKFKRYHIAVFKPVLSMVHDPISLFMNDYHYIGYHMYTDSLGRKVGNDVLFGKESRPTRAIDKDEIFIFSKEKIIIKYLKSCYEKTKECKKYSTINGTYKIVKSPPESWGVRISK